jgi:hypothetical protein
MAPKDFLKRIGVAVLKALEERMEDILLIFQAFASNLI